MTPESAAASHKAARLDGWYDNTWHHQAYRDTVARVGYQPTSTQADILRHLKNSNGPQTIGQIAKAIGRKPESTRSAARIMKSKGTIGVVAHGPNGVQLWGVL